MSLHGWNMYDSRARWQYARLPRFSTLDPLAEKYYHVSPYAYCGNDFVNFVDPSGEDPGDWFATPQKAAIDFGKLYNDNSIRENREYGAFIIQIADKNGNIGYTYNIPKRGTKDSVNNYPVPYGIPIVASVHTHAAYIEGYLNNLFSGAQNTRNARERRSLINGKGDLSYSNSLKIDNYLATPNGSLQKYDYKTGKISIISNSMPSDKNDPDRLNNIEAIENHATTWNDCLKEWSKINDLINNYLKLKYEK